MLGNLKHQIVLAVVNGRICYSECRGRSPATYRVLNSTSTTAPITCESFTDILTHGTMSSCGHRASYSDSFIQLSLDRFSTGDDFHQLGSDGGLPCTVVLQGQFADHLGSVL